MPDQWFYGQDANKHGPYSSVQLRELAVAGEIRPTDTVWKARVESGVLAGKVKNLFPAAPAKAAAPAAVPPPEAAPAPHVTPAPATVRNPPIRSDLSPPLTADTRTHKPEGGAALQQRKGRATIIKGASIVGQDGTNVQFIKECTVCGQKDKNKSRLPIKQGTMRIGFFCPKCKKLRQVEIQGIL